MKLDMSKAYNRVLTIGSNRIFLKEMILQMGFDLGRVSFIMKCVTTVRYSVIINGKAGEVFQPSRGFRQGDPLSLFLFLICSEGLSALMILAMKDGLLREAKTSRNSPQVSHLLLVDNCVLFVKVTARLPEGPTLWERF